jgi:hypothetical protein
MAQNPHEYLIEQLQFTGDESVGSSSNKIKLNFNHPCKELVWVVQPDKNVDYCAAHEANEPLNALFGAQPFNYTDAYDALPPSIMAFGGNKSVVGATAASNDGFINASGLFENPFANDLDSQTSASYDKLVTSDGTDESSLSDAGTFVLAETAHKMHCWGQNPVVTAKLQLNGQDRFSEREGTYFDLVQPWQHHTRSPDTGINVYSCALRPEEHQPSNTKLPNFVFEVVVMHAASQV